MCTHFLSYQDRIYLGLDEWVVNHGRGMRPTTPYKPLPPLIIEVSALKMEAECYSETLASTDESTRRYNPKERLNPIHRTVVSCLV